MSRSGYSDDYDQRDLAMWRGQVESAIRGKRGQAFLKELLASLEAMPEKRLIAHDLRKGGEVCALGCIGASRGVANLDSLDPYDYDTLSGVFGIARQLVQEIEFINDDDFYIVSTETAETRWQRVHRWVIANIKATP